MLLLFYIVNALSGLADLTATLLGPDKLITVLILDVLRATVPTVLLWIAGTFPIEETLPCPNVATEKDVSISGDTC